MALRLRKIKSKVAIGGFEWIALCAAENSAKDGDIYLNDGMHTALTWKFSEDFYSMGFIVKDKRFEDFINSKK